MAADQPTHDGRKDKRNRTAYHARQKADRLTAGLCIQCGKTPHLAGKQLCPTCTERAHERQATARERKRLRQGKPPKGTPKPPPVSADMPAYKRAWRQRMKAAGVCSACGCRSADAGRSRCAGCRSKDRTDYVRIGRSRYKKRAALVGNRDKAQRDAWRAARRCTWCGGEPRKGHRRCRDCTLYMRAKLRERATRFRVAGLCPRCGGGRDADATSCLACLEKERGYFRRLMQLHPDKVRARIHRRRRALQTAGGSFTAEEWRAVKAAQGYTCLMCGRKEPQIALTIDHVVPISKGGSNDIGNVQAACERCNKSKSNRSNRDCRHLAPFPELFPWFVRLCDS